MTQLDEMKMTVLFAILKSSVVHKQNELTVLVDDEKVYNHELMATLKLCYFLPADCDNSFVWKVAKAYCKKVVTLASDGQHLIYV